MNYFEERKVKKESLKRFRIFTPEIVKKTFVLAKKFKKEKIIHFNSTMAGGGVANLIEEEISFSRGLNLEIKGYVLKGPKKFFSITKKIHNLLQGRKGTLKKEEKIFYLNYLFKKVSPEFIKIIKEKKPSVVLLHDPQLLPLVEFIPKKTKKVLRLHIDLSLPNKDTLSFLKNFILSYDKVIFSHPDYPFAWLPKEKREIIFPAINPLNEKNRFLRPSLAKEIIFSFGINPEKPIISQIARFDFWKDQLFTLKAYYLAKKKFSNLQLILVGFIKAKDDPEAVNYLKKIKKHSQGDKDIFLFSDISQIKNISEYLFINAVNTASDIFIHKSIREGFGLAVTEAMWKKKPVIGGKAKGIEIQIENGKDGFLIDDIFEAASLTEKLLTNKKLAKKIGESAHQKVKENFLLSRLIFDKINLYLKLRS